MYHGGRRPPYTLYEHVRTNMLVALAPYLFSERMEYSGFNALKLIGKGRLSHFKQPSQLGEVDAPRDIPVAFSRSDFKHFALTGSQESSPRASG